MCVYSRACTRVRACVRVRVCVCVCECVCVKETVFDCSTMNHDFFQEYWKYDPFDACKDNKGDIYARGAQVKYPHYLSC